MNKTSSRLEEIEVRLAPKHTELSSGIDWWRADLMFLLEEVKRLKAAYSVLEGELKMVEHCTYGEANVRIKNAFTKAQAILDKGK